MRQNILFGLTMLIAVAFIACDKAEFDSITPESPVGTRAPQNKSLVKEQIGDDYTGTFKYNNKGQIIEELYNSGDYKITYTYLPNLVEMKEFDSAGTLLKTTIMKLNPKGLVIEFVESGLPRTMYFQYDSKNRVTKEWIIYDDGSMGNEFFFFYNSAGDMVKDSLQKPDGVWTVYVNDFYTDVPNTIAHENYGKNFFGKQSKHCMKRRVMTSSIGELITYDFTLPVQDAEERVVERAYTITNFTNNNSYTVITQYAYY